MEMYQPVDSTESTPFPELSAEPVELLEQKEVVVDDGDDDQSIGVSDDDQDDGEDGPEVEEGEIPTRKVGNERIEAIHFKRYGKNIEIRESTEEYVQKVTFVDTKKESSIEIILYSVGNLPMIHLNDVDIPLSDFLQFKYIEKVDESTSVVNYGNNEYITLPAMSNDLLIALLTYLGVKSEDTKQKEEEIYTYSFHATLSTTTIVLMTVCIYIYYLVKGWIAIENKKYTPY